LRKRSRGAAPSGTTLSPGVADTQSVAQLMGLDNRHVFALAMALSLSVVAIAGVFLAVRANFDPAIGPARLIFGFEAVIIGGLGSL
jgi:branched-chain amino acid transport system permease protein